MKYFALLLLIIAVTSKRYVPAQKSNDAIDVIKCFAQKGIPLAFEYYQKISQLITEEKYLELIIVIQELVGEAKTVINECLGQVLRFDWKCFGMCILESGGRHLPELQELVDAIIAGDWAAVAAMVPALLFKGIPCVVRCYDQC